MAQVYKSAGLAAARVAGEMSEMDDAMSKVLAAVKSGGFLRSIESGRVKGKKGVTDRAVWTNHPAAWPIEFGHLSGKVGSEGRKKVPGKFAFTNGAKRAGGA